MEWEHSNEGPALLLSSTRPSAGRRGRRRRLASIASSQLVLPAAASAGPAPLAVLAQAHHGLVMAAAAAARALLHRPNDMPLLRRPSRKASQPPALAASTEQRAPEMLHQQQQQQRGLQQAWQAQPQQRQGQHVRAAQQFLAGGVAGAVSKTLVAPMERVSTLLMTPTAQQRFSLTQAAQHAWRDGGVLGLYRGHAATLVKIFPASAIQFAVFNSVKDAILHQRAARQQGVLQAQQQAQHAQQQAPQQAELANHERLAAGAAAGAAAACCCYPLESTRTAMACAGGVSGNLPQAARSLLVSHGLPGLYRGFRAALIGDVLGNALGFTAYEAGNRLYRDLSGGRTAPPHIRGLIGACSAACVLTLTMPLEVVRRRLQVQGLAGRPVLYRGTWHCLQTVAKKEGLGSFYAASIPSYLKVAPSIGCMYFCFELLMSLAPPPDAPTPPLAAATKPADSAAVAAES